jgi:hypothetical protein
MALDWNKAMKRVRERNDLPEDPDPKRRKLSSALEGLGNHVETAFITKDGGEYVGDPMDWSLTVQK